MTYYLELTLHSEEKKVQKLSGMLPFQKVQMCTI